MHSTAMSRTVVTVPCQWLSIARMARMMPARPTIACSPEALVRVREAFSVISGWTPAEALVRPEEGRGQVHRLIESTAPGVHRVETTLTGLVPGKTAVLSFPAKAIGARGVFVELQTAEQRGGGYCDLYRATAQRDGDMFDVGVEMERDGRLACWVAMPIGAPSATLRLSLMDEYLEAAYAGDGKSGAEVGPVELRETTRFVAQESSPW